MKQFNPKLLLPLLILIPSIAMFNFSQMWDSGITVSLFLSHSNTMSLFFLTLLVLALILFLLIPYLSKPLPIYLINFSCFKPPPFCRVPFATFLENAAKIGAFDAESVNFMAKILSSSGLSEETYLPPALHYIPPKSNQSDFIKEAEMVLFSAMDDLISKSGISGDEIDILIINCSGFCPSPSLSSVLINEFKLKIDIKSFNLSGMGCSAGIIAVDLAKNLLKTRKNSNALILSTEILSTGWYSGNEKQKLVLNCVFRMGGAAVLLTNKKELSKCSKYKLFCSLRTQRAFDDRAYYSAFREEDSAGKLGVTLKKDLLQVAGEFLRSNVTILGQEILPMSEKLQYLINVARRKFANKSTETYVPNFKTVIKHFCLPTSGRAVIREIGKGLKLGEEEMEAALMTLHRFGNQSSSSLWYELAYLEAKEKVKKGDKVWLLGMGSGPKSCSLVLECLRDVVGESIKGPWAECIDQYPKDV